MNLAEPGSRLAAPHGGRRMAAALKKLLTTDEVAEILRVERRAVQRLVRLGRLPAVRILERILIDPDDLAEWIHANTVNRPETEVDRALRWLGEHELEQEHPLCPRCAKREQSDSGLCTVCEADKRRAIEERADQERARKLDWWHSEKGRSAKDRRRARRNGADDA